MLWHRHVVDDPAPCFPDCDYRSVVGVPSLGKRKCSDRSSRHLSARRRALNLCVAVSMVKIVIHQHSDDIDTDYIVVIDVEAENTSKLNYQKRNC